MNLNEYQSIIDKTAIYPKEIGVAYCALGLAGEAGEVADKIKKLYRDQELHSLDAVGKLLLFEENRTNIAKELGDVIWYVTALANEFDLSLEQIMKMNYDKLIKRRETNTLKGSGDNREEI